MRGALCGADNDGAAGAACKERKGLLSGARGAHAYTLAVPDGSWQDPPSLGALEAARTDPAPCPGWKGKGQSERPLGPCPGAHL